MPDVYSESHCNSNIWYQYGKKLKEVSSDGKVANVTFEDGTSASGDLVIGAEGAHSVVREALLGPEKAANTPSPLISTFTIAKLPADAVKKFEELAHRLMVVFHPDGYFMWVGRKYQEHHSAVCVVLTSSDQDHDTHADGDPEFMMAMSWTQESPDYDPTNLKGDQILADAKKRVEIFGERLKFMWQSIPDDTRCWHSRLSYWLPEPWDNKNGTLTLGGGKQRSVSTNVQTLANLVSRRRA